MQKEGTVLFETLPQTNSVWNEGIETSSKWNIIFSSKPRTHCTFAGHALLLKSEQEKHAAGNGGQPSATSHESTLGNRLDTFSFRFLHWM